VEGEVQGYAAYAFGQCRPKANLYEGGKRGASFAMKAPHWGQGKVCHIALAAVWCTIGGGNHWCEVGSGQSAKRAGALVSRRVSAWVTEVCVTRRR